MGDRLFGLKYSIILVCIPICLYYVPIYVPIYLPICLSGEKSLFESSCWGLQKCLLLIDKLQSGYLNQGVSNPKDLFDTRP